MKKILIDGENLTITDVVSVARNHTKVDISPKAKINVERSRQTLERLVNQKKVVYGVTTGFGAFGNITIPMKNVRELQTNLIRSHAAGVGKPATTDIVRAMMLLRANTLAKGYSGIHPQTLQTLIEMLNKGVHPIVPEQGSVGASGDLAPLSHMTLVLIGEGEAEYKSQTLSGGEAMKAAGIKPIQLEAKEGVALNNGTQYMTAIAALTVHDAERLISIAETAAALSMEALVGISDALDPKIHKARPHQGQIICAQNLRALLQGSKLIMTSREAADKGLHPQDPYSLRCTPQVLGPVRDAITYTKKIIETEINSATDNPLIFNENNTCLSGGNFHGQPIAITMDFLALALTTVGNISERRTARLIDENLSRGLLPFLIYHKDRRGVESGFMALQYTAAALTSENKALSHPASVDSIPTSANFEDLVSMGPTAARKAADILRNVEHIVAIELLGALQGADLRGGSAKLGKGTRAAYDLVRRRVPTLKKDRPLFRDVREVVALVQNGELSKAVKPFLNLPL